MPLVYMGGSSVTDSFQGVEQVRVYADPGTAVGVHWARTSSSGIAAAVLAISGYYVNVSR
jgi:hypothetical protein